MRPGSSATALIVWTMLMTALVMPASNCACTPRAMPRIDFLAPQHPRAQVPRHGELAAFDADTQPTGLPDGERWACRLDDLIDDRANNGHDTPRQSGQ